MSDPILDSFELFLADPQAFEFYITGPAGTGKTTYLNTLYQFALSEGKSCLACAYTHKACNVLRSKLAQNTTVATLHSYLKKRPSINDHAKHIDHISVSSKFGNSEHIDIVFIDEYSMLGEKDYKDIGLIQDPDCTGEAKVKVVYLGDQNQLPPVGDIQAISPTGKYKHKLTKIHRQAGDSSLLDVLSTLVSYIDGSVSDMQPLVSTPDFIRGISLRDTYTKLLGFIPKDKKVILAYTNQAVQSLNALIAEKDYATPGDEVFSPSTRKYYTLIKTLPTNEVKQISRAFGDPLELDSKYKSLEHLIKLAIDKDIYFVDLKDEDGIEETYATIFGHYNYKQCLEGLANIAVAVNKEIEDQFQSNAKDWALCNKSHPLSIKRARAWRDYITVKENVICIDFPYAMTVHKSQGSTFDYVLIDIQDLGICAERDYDLYLKLLYVAISRAAKTVYTN